MLLSAIHLMLNLRMLLPTVAVVQPLHVIVAVTVDCHPLVVSSVCGLMVQPLLLCNMSRCCAGVCCWLPIVVIGHGCGVLDVDTTVTDVSFRSL